MKRKNLPFNELSIEVTHRCILNCIFCSSSASNSPEIHEIIDIKRVKEIIKECKEKFKINTISISGGEPLLYPHFNELIRFILHNELDLLIYTSGIVLKNSKMCCWSDNIIDNFIDFKHEYNRDIEIVFDIQAPDKKNYELITRIKGSYNSFINTLDKLKIVPELKKSSHFVPFKLNWKLIEETINFCQKYNLDHIKILRFVPQGRAANFSLLSLNLKEFYILQKNLEFLKNKYGNMIKLGHPIDFLFLLDNNKVIRSCRGGFDAPIILPNGNVYPCPAWKKMQNLCAGNINDSSFEEIWNSNYFINFRDFITEGYVNIIGLCEDCRYLDECKGKCVAQRILKYHNEPVIPKCFIIGPDPLCLKLDNII